MATQKNCLTCKKEFWGNRNKVFCSDACRKHASRHPEIKASYLSGQGNDGSFVEVKPHSTLPILPVIGNGKSGQGRTVGGRLLEHFGKRTIDSFFGINDLSSAKNGEKKPNQSLPPIKMKSLDGTLSQNLPYSLTRILNTPPLSAAMKTLLGDITLPFQILIWGLPGQGKSTFSLKLASELSKFAGVLIVAGEEDIESNTFSKRIGSTIEKENLKHIKAVSRLPNGAEWLSALDRITDQKEMRFVVYDSINVLGLIPNHAKSLNENPILALKTKGLGHIYISQAQKDGKAYMGNAAWGHEVDVIIKVVEGKAIIEKNRFATDEFGKAGSQFSIFG